MAWTKVKPITAKTEDQDIKITFYMKDNLDGYGQALHAIVVVESDEFNKEVADFKVRDYTTTTQFNGLVTLLRSLRDNALSILGYTSQ
jgi:hypothetical protein